MLKHFTIIAAFGLASVTTIASAETAETRTFVHGGQTYSYSVEKKADARVLRGTHDRTGQAFVLYVTDKRVSGTVGGQYVSFKRSAVKSLNNEVQIASR